MPDQIVIKRLEEECKRIEEDTEHSFKAHYNSAEFWSRVNLMLGLPSAILGVIAGGTSAYDGGQAIVTGTALLASALVTCLTFLKPGEKSDSHKNAGNLYHSLRNKTRLLREIELVENSNNAELKDRLYELFDRRDELNVSMPSISSSSYEKAKKDIDAGRARYQVDKDAEK